MRKHQSPVYHSPLEILKQKKSKQKPNLSSHPPQKAGSEEDSEHTFLMLGSYSSLPPSLLFDTDATTFLPSVSVLRILTSVRCSKNTNKLSGGDPDSKKHQRTVGKRTSRTGRLAAQEVLGHPHSCLSK